MRHKIVEMRKILTLILIGLVLLACGSEITENTMIVSGNIKGLKKGTLYLQKISDSVLTSIDSLTIEGDGNFSLKAELEDPEIFYLYLEKNDNNEVNDRITFFGEPGTITINTSWNTFDTNASISGSTNHKKLEEYRSVMSRMNTENLEILQGAMDPEIQKDSLALDSIQKASDRNLLRRYLYSLNFAINNKDSHVAPYVALTEVADANIKYLDSVYYSLSPEVANAKYGRALQKYLEELKSDR